MMVIPSWLELQLTWIRRLQELRGPFVDTFFTWLNFFDTQEFYFLLIPAVWLGYHWRAGFRLFSILLLSSLSNQFLKQIFELPRPYQIDPSLGLIQVGGYGLPSGASQSAILLPALLISVWKSRWSWVIGGCYFFLISLSRVFLGVHFPTDLLGGWIVGALLWLIYVYVRPPFENQLKRLDEAPLLALSQLIPLLLMTLYPTSKAVTICGFAMGSGLGLLINARNQFIVPIPHNTKEFLLRAFVGTALLSLMHYVTLLIPFVHTKGFGFVQFYFLGLWLSMVCNWVTLPLSRLFSLRFR